MSDRSSGQKREEQSAHMFNPNEHLMQLKSREGSKDYLPVQWRLVWFRSLCPQGTIDTEEVEVDLDREMEEEAYVWNSEKRRSEKVVKRAKGYARFKATITDGKGQKHDWRAELSDKLASLQKPDGSWVGEKKWFEDNPVLTTAYTILALQEIQQDLKQHPAK